MVRYKRYKNYGRRRSTNAIRMKFQSFMDISTSDSSMQIITISAGGPEILRRLAPQFGAYKYYRIGNISVKLVPASTLPVDPTGLSYTVGDQLVDPRDQLTPGMMRITNGEDVFENISGLSDAQQRGIYNNMLLDPRWFKWMLQSGVKRHATPRYWQIGQLHQDKWPGAITNIPVWDSVNEKVVGSDEVRQYAVDGLPDTQQIDLRTGSSPYGIFQTGHRGYLGWLPTDGLQPIGGLDAGVSVHPLITSPPEVEVMKIILPKAYKSLLASPSLSRELGIIIVCSSLRPCTSKSLSSTSVLVTTLMVITGLLISSIMLKHLFRSYRVVHIRLILISISILEVTMATIKVFDVNGVKELQCFDTLPDVPYLEPEEIDPNDIAEDTDDGF